MKKALFFLFVIAALVTSCTNTPVDNSNLYSEIDSLKIELSRYKDKFGELPSATNKSTDDFGIWKVSYYVDEFDEPTNTAYITTDVYGTFSNSATTNSNLKVRFLIDADGMRIQLYEYARNHPIKGEGTLKFKVKNSKGDILDFETYNSDSGNNSVKKKDLEKLKKMITEGGEFKFIAISNRFGSPSEYNFTLKDAGYLEKALSKLNQDK